MSIVDTHTDTILHRITLDYPPSGFILSPINPSLIYVRHMNVEYETGFHSIDDGYLQEINIETKQIGRKVKTGKNPLNIIITKDGKRAYLSCGMSDRIDIIDLEKMTIIGKIDTSPSPHGIAFAE
jgi:DNA-binding beta-propeller fold protein YncE